MNTIERINNAENEHTYLWEDFAVEVPVNAKVLETKEAFEYILPISKATDEFIEGKKAKTDTVLTGGYFFKCSLGDHKLEKEMIDSPEGGYSVIKPAKGICKKMYITVDIMDGLKLQNFISDDEAIVFVNGLADFRLSEEFHQIEQAYVLLPWHESSNHDPLPQEEAFIELYGNAFDIKLALAPVAPRSEKLINFTWILENKGINEIKNIISSASIQPSATGRFPSSDDYTIYRNEVKYKGKACDIHRAITVKEIISGRNCISYKLRFCDAVGDIREVAVNASLLALNELSLSDPNVVLLINSGIAINVRNLKEVSDLLQSFESKTRGVVIGKSHPFRIDTTFSKDAWKQIKLISKQG